ncbi:MAG TPA: right-handed parallel beta-helix repeat-containing protein [Fimbriimonadaceae bacterium]|nr:right-handed parallel beta-helix repeat-containing protein [Fimbriimonadaceae bacterium]HRJ95385.1 right-handed parallel beta-helix repeat-containing protein [Fimbriimonadaceae bacterium]
MTALILALSLNVAGQPIVVNSLASLRAAVQSATPGATVLLAPGTYTGGIFLSDIHGQAGQPITIAGQSSTNPPIIQDGSTAFQISKTSHIVLRDFVIRRMANNGINIDDGGVRTQPSHHIRIERLDVSELPTGIHDGIKLSGVDDFVVQDCIVKAWGGSAIDMVGCHKGVIRACLFQNGGDSGVQAKGGSSDVAVYGCRFVDYGQRGVNLGGSTDFEFFRPPIETMTEKYEAKNLTVEGCTFVRGRAPVAFVGVDRATVAYCTIYQPERWAMRILQETVAAGFVPCRSGAFRKNLVVFTSTQWGEGGVNIGPNTYPRSFRFEGNFWYCTDRPDRSTPTLPTAEIGGTYGVNPQATLVPPGTVTVPSNSPARAIGAHAWVEGKSR